MARFDLPRRRDEPGHLPIVQSHLHDHPSTRIVVPPIPADAAPRPARGLDPALEIEADRRILSPQDMAAIPRRDLGRPVGHLGHEQDTMTRALDILFTGFRRQPAITRARRAPRAERTGGDLRIAHFLGIRAMQALPAPGGR